MFDKKSFNSDVFLLVLGRPADPLCTILSAYLSGQGIAFSVCSSVYQVLSCLKTHPVNQPVVLVARPPMLGSQAVLFLKERFSNLRIVGWLDPNESLSGAVMIPFAESGMTLVTHCDQLRHVIDTFHCTSSAAVSAPEPGTDRKIEPLEYELCDDELNALLGVE